MSHERGFHPLPALLVGLVMALPAWSDERCVEQCDTQSDRCMQDAEGDEDKQKACDDAYSDCLKTCK